MIKVGLTGNIGSGKSTVSRIFSALDVPVFIADTEAKMLYKIPDVKLQVRKLFGDGIFNAEGEVDFKALANIIFNDKHALAVINAIIHPLTLDRYRKWLELQHKAHYTIHESAILFENNLQDHFDKIINVSAPLEIRLKRVTERDHVPSTRVRERMMNQMPDEVKNSRADFVIVNDGSRFLITQVIEINKQIRNKKWKNLH